MIRALANTPYVDALSRYVERGVIPFHTPGHKQGRGTHPRLKELLGLAALKADVSDVVEAKAFEDDFVEVLRESERLAARVFGSTRSIFLANGTTSGLHAALWATCRPGDRVLIARDAHRSVLGGLALIDARPVYLAVDAHREWGIPLGIDMDKLDDALDRYRDVRAVLLTSPNYYGVTTDVRAAAAVVHARGIPLIVDQAHGPHLRFHPSLPPSAQESGADLVVDSTHKWLGALTQGSMLHVLRTQYASRREVGDLVERVERAVDLLQSTSPSPLLFASLDAARAQMEDEGTALLDRTLGLAREARRRIGVMPGLQVLGERDVVKEGASAPDGDCQLAHKCVRGLDPTKLLVRVAGAGWTGPDVDRTLRKAHGIQIELHGTDHILALITIGDTEETVDALLKALKLVSARRRPTVMSRRDAGSLGMGSMGSDGHGRTSRASLGEDALYEPVYTPRDAVRSDSRPVPRAQAEGHVAAETITPYPPGIPLWTAGERITSGALQRVDELLRVGGLIRGAADATLETLRVVAL